MPRTLLAPLLVSAAVWLGGCNSGVSVDQACTDLAAARCAKLQFCTTGAGITRTWGDLMTCQIRNKLDCLNRLGAPDETNTPALTASCATALSAQSCGDFFLGTRPAPCAIPQGPRGEDSPCIGAGQCQSSFCKFSAGAGCGVCSASPQVGEFCERGDCVGGNYCVADTTSCQTPVSAGSMCDKDHYCAPDLSCTGSPGICQKSLSTAGVPCDPKQQTTPACDVRLGLYCHPTSQQCTEYTYVGENRPCGVFGDGTSTLCLGGGLCLISKNQLSGTCKQPVFDGRHCDVAVGPPCLFPARCATTGGTAGTCTIPDATLCR